MDEVEPFIVRCTLDQLNNETATYKSSNDDATAQIRREWFNQYGHPITVEIVIDIKGG